MCLHCTVFKADASRALGITRQEKLISAPTTTKDILIKHCIRSSCTKEMLGNLQRKFSSPSLIDNGKVDMRALSSYPTPELQPPLEWMGKIHITTQSQWGQAPPTSHKQSELQRLKLYSTSFEWKQSLISSQTLAFSHRWEQKGLGLWDQHCNTYGYSKFKGSPPLKGRVQICIAVN